MTASDVFDRAIQIMDYGDETTGASDNDKTKIFKNRSVALLNVLIAESLSLCGIASPYPTVAAISDEIAGVPDAIVCAILPYGLASALTGDSNTKMSNYWRQCYEQAISVYAKDQEAEFMAIEDLYGGIENSEYGAWQ